MKKMRKINVSFTGLPRSACDGQVPTSFLEAHSHPTAGSSDTGLAQLQFTVKNNRLC
jgi:hypothetical protein